jgi:FMN-dependent NADH-azoreductase
LDRGGLHARVCSHRSPARDAGTSDRLIDEVFAADVIVLGIPMHNFSVPATFKAWIDQIARAGKTFSYSDQGPQGLIPSDKKVIAVLTRGGVYAGDGAEGATDFQVSYLRRILGLIGLTDVTFIHADRQGMGGQAAQLATEKALQQVASLIPFNSRNAAWPRQKSRPQTVEPSLTGGSGGFVANPKARTY